MVLHYARAAPRCPHSRNKPRFSGENRVFFARLALRFDPFKTIDSLDSQADHMPVRLFGTSLS